MPTTTTQSLRQRIRALERPAQDVHIIIGAAGTPGAVLVNGRPAPADFRVPDGPLDVVNPRGSVDDGQPA